MNARRLAEVLVCCVVTLVALSQTGCVPAAVYATNVKAGQQVWIKQPVPTNRVFYVKQRDIDNFGWKIRIEDFLKTKGETIVKHEAEAENVLVWAYDYQASYDVFHYTLKYCDFAIRSKDLSTEYIGAHFPHWSTYSIDTILQRDLEEIYYAVSTGTVKARAKNPQNTSPPKTLN